MSLHRSWQITLNEIEQTFHWTQSNSIEQKSTELFCEFDVQTKSNQIELSRMKSNSHSLI